MGLAAMQPRFVEAVGLAGRRRRSPTRCSCCCKEALNYVVFIPWSTGDDDAASSTSSTPTSCRRERWNARWWELAAALPGHRAARPRAARSAATPATKTHINDDPAQYYDYALSFVLLFQLHDHIAREILHEDPHDTNYYGRREVGDFLTSILRAGRDASTGASSCARRPARTSRRARCSSTSSPCASWLREQNRGRTCTLPEL